MKKNNIYKIQLQEIELKGNVPASKTLEFTIENHDDIIQLIENNINSNMFPDDAESQSFILGLKLFSEVMMKNRDMELFGDFYPEFGKFMKKLKSMR